MEVFFVVEKELLLLQPVKKSRARRINSAPLPCITFRLHHAKKKIMKRISSSSSSSSSSFVCFLLLLLLLFSSSSSSSSRNKTQKFKKNKFFFVFFQKEKKRNNSVCTKKRRGGNTTHISILSRHHLYARVHLRPRERSRRQRGDRALVVAPPSSRVVKRKVFLFFWR